MDEQGQTLGTHGGIHRFTVGQRKGLGLGSAQTDGPLYVLQLQPSTGDIVVGPRASLERTTLTASGVNWITPPPGPEGRVVTAQIRHRHHACAGNRARHRRDVGRGGIRHTAAGHHARTGRGVL